MYRGGKIRLIYVFVALSVLLWGCSVELGSKAPATPPNLIVNGTLEDGLEGWPVSSSVDGLDVDVSVEDGVMTIMTTEGESRLGIVSQIVRELEIGQKYVFSAQMKTVGGVKFPEDKESGAYIRLRAAGASGNTHPLVYTDWVTETDGWHDVNASIVIPEGTTRLHIELRTEYVSGTFQFRDFSMIKY